MGLVIGVRVCVNLMAGEIKHSVQNTWEPRIKYNSILNILASRIK